jgi:hypothetical protein
MMRHPKLAERHELIAAPRWIDRLRPCPPFAPRLLPPAYQAFVVPPCQLALGHRKARRSCLGKHVNRALSGGRFFHGDTIHRAAYRQKVQEPHLRSNDSGAAYREAVRESTRPGGRMRSFANHRKHDMARIRDYAAEYRRRMERGLKRGWSRSKARGHKKPLKPRTKPLSADAGQRFEDALRALRLFNNQKLAAQSGGVSPRAFRRFLRENRLAHFRKGRWRFTDRRQRKVRAITTRGDKDLKVKGFNPASAVMRHRAAVREFLNTNDPSLLERFKNWPIVDAEGRTHHLETRPNVLYRLSAAGSESYEEIYRLTT